MRMGGYDTIASQAPTDPGRSEFSRDLVEALQRSLLPSSTPAVPGVTIEGNYRLGLGGGGGDWYDAIALTDGRLLLVVGDVVGHGVAAASTMGRLRIAVQIYAAEGFTPRQVLERLNRHAFDHATGEVATLLVAVLEPSTGEIVLASAGHLPPVIRSPHGEVILIESQGGPPIGATPRARFADHRVELAAGSVFFLYTDGLVERRGEDLGEGFARLMHAVAQGPGTATDLVDHVVRTCDAHTSPDDVAILVVATDAGVEPLQLHLPARPRVLRSMRNAITQWMTRANIDDADASDILLAVNEAVANAIEHAYGPGDGDVRVDIERVGPEVHVRVRDSGCWRPARPVGGGLGMDLMRNLVEDVVIESTSEGTTVAFRARVRT
jgi:anti-sigma regulatory factor (Ser/Thr protein kinase)